MNNLLQLKGVFQQKKSSSKMGYSNIPKNQKVLISSMKSLKKDLEDVNKFWEKEKLNINPLISVYYKSVVAKSNRMKGIFKKAKVVGAKFSEEKELRHIITHSVTLNSIKDSIKSLDIAIKKAERFGESYNHQNISEIIKKKRKNLLDITKSRLVDIMVDCYYIKNFGVEFTDFEFRENALISIYDTGKKTKEIMEQLGIKFYTVRSINETTMLLNPEQFKILKEKAPYLISMGVKDIKKLSEDDYINKDTRDNNKIQIPSPTNEPIIGVIDTMFDDRVYFSEWVEFENMLDKNIPLEPKDYNHGTQVSSIIVDGSSINPELDDGCGRFRVKHFGVATSTVASSFSVLKSIKEIVEKNKDIKVWNLSLGSSLEINPNFISPEAEVIDKIQYENDVIFVIAGTNKKESEDSKRIGAPADSINSLVVNSVNLKNEPVKYSRKGLVLSFYNKPDVSYYGGDEEHPIRTCSALGERFVKGTSFAAPWISRKLAFLIEKLGLSREVAKALIVDSTTAWHNREQDHQLVGFGVVPIQINEIVKSKKDEIKFVITAVSEKYDTYNYKLEVPKVDGIYPYVAKATLCYFPNCSRSQGVDYTNTELDIHFGPLDSKGKINTINDNKQADEGVYLLYEENVRKFYRKWDNVKHIRQNLKTKKGNKRRGRKLYEGSSWGISVKTKERLNYKDGKNLKFGLVITLKEINGKNRIDDFIQACEIKGWIVNTINIEERLTIYSKFFEKIDLK